MNTKKIIMGSVVIGALSLSPTAHSMQDNDNTDRMQKDTPRLLSYVFKKSRKFNEAFTETDIPKQKNKLHKKTSSLPEIIENQKTPQTPPPSSQTSDALEEFYDESKRAIDLYQSMNMEEAVFLALQETIRHKYNNDLFENNLCNCNCAIKGICPFSSLP